MPNADLIRRTVQIMEREQDRWNQSDWVQLGDEGGSGDPLCGTTLCFGGFALMEHLGAEAFLDKALERDRDGRWWLTSWVGQELQVEARVALDLEEGPASRLFGSMTEDLESFKALVTAVTGVDLP